MNMRTEKGSMLIKNCILTETGEVAEFLIEGGKITAIGRSLECEDAVIIDAGGLYAAPGLVDMHVHLRDPGQTHKEDILSGCRAAAAGGVTSVAAMPNTNPAADNAETLQYILNKAENADARVYPIAAVTKGQQGNEPVDFTALKNAGAVAFSDDGRPVMRADLMLRAMQAAGELKSLVISHCEDVTLVPGGLVNEGMASQTLGVKGLPGAAEEVQVAREVALAASYGLKVHIAHVSTAKSIAIIRDAKRRGVKVTCETCPHYFSLDESYTLGRDADYRMNPPLRTKADIEAVIEGLKDGTIDAIVTDHAPHAAEEKEDFMKAPNGVVGLETSLAAGITYLVKPGHFTLKKLIEKMSKTPANLLKIPAGELRVGADADILLFDPEERWVVEPENLHSKSHNTPFRGMTLTGRVKITICGGRIVYQD